MKELKVKNIFPTAPCALAAAVALTLAACGGRGDTRLSGHFIGAASQPIYLETVVPGTGPSRVDTLVANGNGEFDFRVALPGGEPTVFNLRYDDDVVPLLISPREKVKVVTMDELAGYRVSGSPESELVWQLHGILTGGAKSLDSIYNHLTFAADEGYRARLTQEFYDKLVRVKRRHISFIVENAGSLAALYALYQRLPGEEALSSAETDHLYYRMVADSVRMRYPESRYLKALDAELTRHDNLVGLQSRLDSAVTEVNHPEVELPDMYGNRVRLSSMDGRVVVLDFWTAADARSRVNNAEMKEMWADLSERGMAVYQVSLDTDKALWVSTVQEQRMPWASLCDFRGAATPAAGLYNLQGVPANFVIDRSGRVVAKNLYGDPLRRKVEELLK
jgi:peroxiredoxin